MKKKLLAVLLTLSMVLSLMPAIGMTASAAEGDKTVLTSPLDCTTMTEYVDKSGTEGWSWAPKDDYISGSPISASNNSGTLTLSGVTINTVEATALKLPDGAIIELTGDTVNTITSTYNGNVATYGIDCSYLLVQGTGALDVASGNSTGSNSSGIFTLALNITGGTITTTAGAAGGGSGGSHGISAPSGLGITAGDVTAVAGEAGAGNVRAINGILTTPGTVMAGADAASADEQDTSYSYSLTSKYVNVNTNGAFITVGAQTGTLTYADTENNTATFNVSASNFAASSFDPQIQWYVDGSWSSTPPAGLSAEMTNDNTNVTVTYTNTNADAGTYKFKVVSGEDDDKVESAQATLTVSKAIYPETLEKTIYIMTNMDTSQEFLLYPKDIFTTLPKGMRIDSSAAVSLLNDILYNYGEIKEGGLYFVSNKNLSTAGLTVTIDIFFNSANYEDITAKTHFTTKGKTKVTIGGVSLDGLIDNQKTYDGKPISYTGTTTASNPYIVDRVDIEEYIYTWSKTDGPTLASAPKEAGSYTLTVSVPESNEVYTGSLELPFTIEKKDITVKPNAKNVTVGAAMPGFTLDVSGVTVADNADKDLEELLKRCTFAAQVSAEDDTPVTTATAGSYVIKWTNMDTIKDDISSWDGYANYEVTWEDSATLTVASPSSSSGGAAPATTVPVIVDGEEYNIGKAETSSGVTTVVVDQTALQKQLDAASDTVIVPVDPGRNADTVVAKLVVANVDEMAEKEMTLSVQMDNVSYVMPAVAINTETIMKELGATDPNKVPVNVTSRSSPMTM